VNHSKFKLKPISAVVLAFACSGVLNAQVASGGSSVQSVIDRTLQKNPELQVKIHALQTATATSDVVFGDLLPRVDVRSSAGRERSAFESSPTLTYNNNTLGIEAKQLIFNGFSSQAAYQRETSTSRSKYFEIEETANSLALDIARAYFNVVRYKAMVKLAEDNYQRHQTTLGQIQKKVEAGVGRRSDLDQTIGRISLALSNVTTERTNFYSALTQYQRLTGEAWPESEMGQLDFEAAVNTDQLTSLKTAFDAHPSIRAATARLEASVADVRVAQGGFYPRVDLRARSDRYSNYLATQEKRTISAVEFLASLNLYKGGSDMAQQRVAATKKNQLIDDRVRVCNTVRQSVQAAIYDVNAADKKIGYLQTQVASIEKARAAYIQQFDVGQKNLLDLLDAENELYQSQRAVLNARADRSIGRTTLLSSQGKLLEALRINSLQTVNMPEKRAMYLTPPQIGIENTDTTCPEDLLQVSEIPLPDASQFANISSQLGKSSLLANAAQSGTAAVESLPSLPPSDDGRTLEKSADEVSKLTEQWAKVWSAKEADNYLSLYSSRFKPENNLPLATWKAQRKARLSGAKSINVKLADVQVAPSFDSNKEIEVKFIQKYSSDSHKETSNKTLVWAQEGSAWRIVRERNSVAVDSAPSKVKKIKAAKVAENGSDTKEAGSSGLLVAK
jgi:adhesin transport system outer membrane protein